MANDGTNIGSALFEPLRWFELYSDYLFAYARRRVRDITVAEDLVQETFLAAVKTGKSFSGASTEKTWLTGILKHKIYDHYRKNSYQDELTSEETDLSGYESQFKRDDEWDGHWNNKYAPLEWKKLSPSHQIEEQDFQFVFANCLTGLPERIANAFVMREVDGMASSEICKLLMISMNNYWTMMHRARFHLRRCIEIKWLAGPSLIKEED